MEFFKRLKALNVFDYIFVLIEIIILGIMIIFQIKTITNCSDLVKYAQLYYPGVKICKIFLIGLPFLWIVSYFISHIIDDKHKIFDFKNLMVIYVLLGLIANIFTLAMENYPIINMSIFLGSYLLLGFALIKDSKEIYIHVIALILFLALALVISSLRSPIGIIASLCAGLLVSNLILTIFKYVATKNKYYLYFLIGIAFALISDVSLGLRSVVSNNVLNNIVSFIVWPTYVISLIMLIFGYNIYHQSLDIKEN